MKQEHLIHSNLPNILTEEALNEHIKGLASGNPLSRDALILHNLRRVKSRIMTKFRRFLFIQEELMEIGTLGLIQGIDSFNPTRNVKFSTYVTICIDNAISNYIKPYLTYLKVESLDFMIRNEHTLLNNSTLNNHQSLVQSYEEKEILQLIWTMIDSLPSPKKEIMKLRFSDPKMTYDEIGALLHYSNTNVRFHIKSSIEIIRKGLIESGILEQKKQLRLYCLK